MLSEKAKDDLEKQGYRVVGSHSAVKTCGWTKKMIKGEGGCYKLKFYGIMSNQCLQMTTSISCANRCVFCWRGYKAPVSKEWKWGVDDPEMIVEESIKTQKKLLDGFGGNPNVNKVAYESSKTVRHVALSLTGEPITYPRINESIRGFHDRKISTFLVTNAQYPDQIEDLEPVTQLYLSVDAPNKAILKEVDVPLFKDYWERMVKSLEALARKPYRKCIRLTMIKDLNMTDLDGYADLIQKGNPDFIEIKGYMFVGASRQRLTIENMPLHEEIVSFSKQLVAKLQGYEIVSEHVPSRVVMVAKKDFKVDGKWMTWIDFDKFFELHDQGTVPNALDFKRATPKSMVGLSGKGTLDNMGNEQKKKVLSRYSKDSPFIDEITQELDFWKEKSTDGC